MRTQRLTFCTVDDGISPRTRLHLHHKHRTHIHPILLTAALHCSLVVPHTLVANMAATSYAVTE